MPSKERKLDQVVIPRKYQALRRQIEKGLQTLDTATDYLKAAQLSLIRLIQQEQQEQEVAAKAAEAKVESKG
ncbi:MAG: hypothetical protein ACE5L6_02135 [Candidatus Bathyarchaeia archaeon]